MFCAAYWSSAITPEERRTAEDRRAIRRICQSRRTNQVIFPSRGRPTYDLAGFTAIRWGSSGDTASRQRMLESGERAWDHEDPLRSRRKEKL